MIANAGKLKKLAEANMVKNTYKNTTDTRPVDIWNLTEDQKKEINLSFSKLSKKRKFVSFIKKNTEPIKKRKTSILEFFINSQIYFNIISSFYIFVKSLP